MFVLLLSTVIFVFQSYPIHPCHPYRGRALIITITHKREGWKADVENIYNSLTALNIQTEFMFDLESWVTLF